MKTQDLPLQIVYDQPCFTMQSDEIFLAVTRFGGHVAPVEFYKNSEKPIMPYHIAPWWDEGITAEHPPLLHVLRGDFFCCPFGGNDAPYQGIQYPPHGETANRPWSFINWSSTRGGSFLHLSQEQILRPGLVEKKLALLPAQNVYYGQHILSKMEGPVSPGHHANLRFPASPGSGKLAFSPFKHAQVYIQPTESPENKGYSILKPGAVIKNLKQVPMITGETTDLTEYPARRGFEDIVIICADPGLEFSWTTVTFPDEGYLWFSIKDPKVLASTLLWMSNGGRHYAPWNGRHVNVMGLEEITAFFHEGLAASATPNSLNQLGIQTNLHLSADKSLKINYIQGVAKIPKGFNRVAEVRISSKNKLSFKSENNQTIEVNCYHEFLNDGKLPDLPFSSK